MSEPVLHHRYYINMGSCWYCNRPWRSLRSKWCDVTLEQSVDQSIERAKERQSWVVKRALQELGL